MVVNILYAPAPTDMHVSPPLVIVIMECHHCGDTAAIIKAEPCECHDGITKEPLFGMNFDYDFIGINRRSDALNDAGK